MKLTKLLVLGVLTLMGASSARAVDGNVWVKPELPEPAEFVAFQEVTETTDDNAVYLYNVKARLFYTEGNNWATRASVLYASKGGQDGATSAEEVKGEKVWFLRSDKSKPDGVYELKSYVKNKGAILSTFTDGVASVWTDNNDGANHFWKVTESGGVIKISNADFEKDKFFGWKGSYSDSRIYLINPADEPDAGIEWKLVAPAVYEAWIEQDAVKNFLTYSPAYEAAMALKEVLDQAEEIGANVADQVAVYNNTSSTKDELNAAKTKALEAVAKRKKELEEAALASATAADPKSATSFITNPDFSSGKNTGWTGKPDNWVVNGTSLNAELFDKKTINVYQSITGLPNGVFAVGASAFYRAGDPRNGNNPIGPSYTNFIETSEAARYAKIYAFNGTDTTFNAIMSPFYGAPSTMQKLGTESTGNADSLLWIPNNMDGAEGYMHKLGLYKNYVFTTVKDGSLTLGMFKAQKTQYDWLLVDDFTLTYYGAGADAYQKWSDEMLASYNAWLPGQGVLLTTTYLDAFKATLTGKTASTEAEALANIAAADEALAALAENISLWKQWEAQIAAGKATVEEYGGEEDALADVTEFDDLLFYTDDQEGEWGAIKEAHTLDNEALKEAIDNLKKWIKAIEDAVKNKIEPGDDMTKYLNNPNFDKINVIEGVKKGVPEEGWTGWHTAGSMPTTGGLTSDDALKSNIYNATAEAWNTSSFDLYQEVTGLPAGVYAIEVQGFYRYGRGEDAWNKYNAENKDQYVQEEGAPVYVYMNDIKTPFINVYKEAGHGQEFFADMAEREEDGTIKVQESGEYKWKTVSSGANPYALQKISDTDPALYFPNGMASAAVCFSEGLYKQTAKSLLAQKGDTLRIGVKGSTNQLNDSWVIFDNFKLTYLGFDVETVKPLLQDAIEKATAKMSEDFAADLKAQLEAALADANAALSETDGRAMFQKLSALVAIDVDASIKLFSDFRSAVTAFETAIANGVDLPARESVLEEAQKVLSEAEPYKDLSSTFTDAQLEDLMKRIEKLTKELLVPAAMETASDENGVDANYLITNPEYDADQDKGNVSGWKLDGTEPGNYRANSGVYEVWWPKANNLVYQDLTDMPAGTYEISVQGVYRYGWAGDDYKAYNENPAANNNGALYVKVGENDAVKKALPRLSTLAKEYETEEIKVNDDGEPVLDNNGKKQFVAEDAWSWGQMTVDADSLKATGYILPDQLKTLTPFFDKDAAKPVPTTSIIFKVGEEGKARIGISIGFNLAGDWTVWDNWKLTYYGPNSTKELTVIKGVKDESAIADVVKTEVYTLSGARVKNGKGIAIVRQTMSDGSVRVKKVMMK